MGRKGKGISFALKLEAEEKHLHDKEVNKVLRVNSESGKLLFDSGSRIMNPWGHQDFSLRIQTIGIVQS